MNEKKQVDKTHYNFTRYMNKFRWASIWHQLDEVIRLKPENILEIGPGPGVFKQLATLNGLNVETLDLDPELKPDHVGSATALPFADSSYDVVCAFQMLEHLPYESALSAFAEMVRVCRRNVIISLPDAKRLWWCQFYVPKIGVRHIVLPLPIIKQRTHVFNGEHYWEKWFLMKLSNFHWPMSQAGIEQAQGKLWFPKPAVKTVAKLIKIFLEIVRRNTVKSSVDEFLHVANHDMHQRQPGFGLFRRCRFLEVLMLFANSVQRRQGVGLHCLGS